MLFLALYHMFKSMEWNRCLFTALQTDLVGRKVPYVHKGFYVYRDWESKLKAPARQAYTL